MPTPMRKTVITVKLIF